MGANFLTPIPGPRRSHASHALSTTVTTLLRFLAPCCGRSSTFIRPRSRASRRAFFAVDRETPARAAMASRNRRHEPCRMASSATTRSTASSLVVKRQARAGGITPVAARVRRRSIDLARSGERCGRRGGNRLFGRVGAAFGALATLATVWRTWMASASRPASSSLKAPDESPDQMTRLSSTSELGEAAAMAASICCTNTVHSPSQGRVDTKRSRRRNCRSSLTAGAVRESLRLSGAQAPPISEASKLAGFGASLVLGFSGSLRCPHWRRMRRPLTVTVGAESVNP